MNSLERRYVNEVLEPRRLAGEIIRYDFEPEKLRLADRTFYEPDFRLVLATLDIEFHEVKGHWEDDARVKIKVVAEMHPYRFVGVQRLRSEWKYERFGD